MNTSDLNTTASEDVPSSQPAASGEARKMDLPLVYKRLQDMQSIFVERMKLMQESVEERDAQVEDLLSQVDALSTRVETLESARVDTAS